MSLNYCLTFDYELFGSGKGCVFKNLVEPTSKILDLLKQSNVKATFFIEQLEIKAIIDRANEFPNNDVYQREAQAISEQLERMLKEGHDLQLHLHPQWFEAEYKSNSWILNFDYWRFSSLPIKSDDKATPSKFNLLIQGKQYLEGLLNPISSDYQCIGFRAGGYNLGFDESTYRAFKDAGILYDSSLCPGYVTHSKLSAYNYSNYKTDAVFSLPYGTVEFPLLTKFSSLRERLSFARIFSALKSKRLKKVEGGFEPSCDNSKATASANANFDVCLSSRIEINYFFKHMLNKVDTTTVLIGHPKDYSIFSPLASIIHRLKKEGFTPQTMTDLWKYNHVHN